MQNDRNGLSSSSLSGIDRGSQCLSLSLQARAVLVSMATSDAENLPRDREFLFSAKRFSVAVSRAECVGVIAASPKLLEAPLQDDRTDEIGQSSL